MSEGSDISEFESTIEDFDDEKSESSSSSSSSSSGEEEREMMDSVKASTSKNKSYQRKNKDDGARITRKIKYIYPPALGQRDERTSPPRMTPYEYASLVGKRADMISRGAKIHPKYANYPTVDLLKIARLELDDSSIPFPLMIKRPIDNPTHPTIVEIWKVRELSTPSQRLTNHIEKYIPENTWRVFD